MHRRSFGLIIVLLVLIGALGVLAARLGYLGGPFGRSGSEYQAVFLTNGQVYFGSFDWRFGSPELRNIYYLQVQRDIQPAEGSDAQSSDVTLVKLGNEVHGPMDVMRLNPDHILFVEDLKTDSRVVRAIEQDQAQ
ncbi:MAG: hypothetical protein ACOYBJ_03665 [Patescibacteria group bacterium]